MTGFKRVLSLAAVAFAVACTDSVLVTEPGTPGGGPSFSVENPGPSVRTNKDDYIPGEMVVMVGSGWEVGETITLTLEENPKIHENRTFTVSADTVGSFWFDEFRPEPHHVGVGFILTAEGQSSGVQAQTTFTDAIVQGPIQTRNNGDPGASELSITTPTPISAGHLMIAQITIEGFGTSQVICTPAGWSTQMTPSIASGRTNNSSSIVQQIFWKVAGASEPGSYIWQFRDNIGSCGTTSNQVTGKGAVGGIISYAGVDVGHSSGPISHFQGATGSNTTFDAPNIASVPGGSRVIRYFGNDKEFEITTADVPASPVRTKRVYSVRRPKAGGGFEKPSGAAADSAQLSTGTTSTVRASNSGNGGNWVAQTVVLREAIVVNHALTVSVVGTGTVTSNPAGINCGADCTENYAQGTSVTLTGAPGTGYGNAVWSGGGGTTNGDGTYTVSMTEARNVTATFTQNSYALAVTKEGNGSGTVTSNPAGIDCGTTCSASFAHGTSVTLTSTPDAGSGAAVWSGGGGTTNGDGTYTVSMIEARSVTATFTLNSYTLTVSKEGNGGGTVTSNPAGIDCGATCSASFDHNTSVTLTGTPNAGSAPVAWSGGGGTTNGDGTYTVSMTETRNVTATFTLNTYALTASVVGSGTVTSNPTGINCGADCTENYAHGTEVTLTAAATVGWTFSGWTGAGTTNGDGTRTVSMTEARSVTATFTQNTYALTVSVVGSGTVTSNPTGINCGADCTENYAHGTDVVLTAAAGAGYSFDPNTGWSGAGTTNLDGTRTVSMTEARSVTATFTLNAPVDNQGPITSNVMANPVALNSAGTVTANVSDVTTGNSNIASAEYKVDDGTWSPMQAQDGSFNSPTENVTVTLTYTTTGVWQICVRGTDIAGNTGNTDCALYVVYDPSGGFVTGGGWINSPAGASAQFPLAVGKANFGFVSKYQKGKNGSIELGGQTEFLFQAGNLNFHSASYQWLVVSGAKAQYKGTGSINGGGNYGFLISAVDGQVTGGNGADKFRIKIWDINNGDAIVYDNEMGTDETAAATTLLGGGSIVIHAKK